MIHNGKEVKPGMFCRYDGCSIWFEIIRVYADALSVVSRRPGEQTEYVGTYHTKSNLFELSESLPVGHWIAGTGLDRRKNFYDKFYPELHRIIPGRQREVYAMHRSRVPRGLHSPVSGF